MTAQPLNAVWRGRLTAVLVRRTHDQREDGNGEAVPFHHVVTTAPTHGAAVIADRKSMHDQGVKSAAVRARVGAV